MMVSISSNWVSSIWPASLRPRRTSRIRSSVRTSLASDSQSNFSPIVPSSIVDQHLVALDTGQVALEAAAAVDQLGRSRSWLHSLPTARNPSAGSADGRCRGWTPRACRPRRSGPRHREARSPRCEIAAQSSTSMVPSGRWAMICKMASLPVIRRTRTTSNPRSSTTGVMISAMRRSMAALAIRSVMGLLWAQKNGRAARSTYRWSLGGGGQGAAVKAHIRIAARVCKPKAVRRTTSVQRCARHRAGR